MSKNFKLFDFRWEDIINKPTLKNVMGQELKIDEPNIRVWLITDREVHVETRSDEDTGWSNPIKVFKADA